MSASTSDVLTELDLNKGRIRRAFLAIVRAIMDSVSYGVIERMLGAGKVAEVTTMLDLGSARLAPLTEAVREALKAGGELEAKAIRKPGAKLRVTFDMRNPAAERWLKQEAAQLVTQIGNDQVAAIRTALEAGLKAGRNPRSVALDIVGRIDRVTGRRIGGMIGLNDNLAGYVANARAELAGENMANYFTRTLRDRRFDAIVRRAMNEGVAVSASDAETIAARYADRLLNLRGETIGRTEALAALNAGRDLSYRQAIAAGTIDAQNVTKAWESAHDTKVRESHRELDGSKLGIDGVFVSPLTGARMRYPGDFGLGAGPGDVINCRCVIRYHTDFLAQNLSQAA